MEAPGIDVLALAEELTGTPIGLRYLRLATIPAAELAALAPDQRRHLVSAVLGEQPADFDRVKEMGLFPRIEVDEAIAQAAGAQLTLGEHTQAVYYALGTNIDGIDPLRFIVAFLHRDWSQARALYDRFDHDLRASPDLMLLAGFAQTKADSPAPGELLFVTAVRQLIERGFLNASAFWGLASLIPVEEVWAWGAITSEYGRLTLRARGAPEALDAVEPFLSRLLTDSPRSGAMTQLFTPLLTDILAAGGLAPQQLLFASDMLSELAEAISAHKAVGLALQTAGRTLFVMGRTDDGVERYRRGADFLHLGHRTKRVWGAQLLEPEDFSVLPSVTEFELAGEPYPPPDPMTRLEGKPIAAAYRPCQSWVAELHGAEVLTGDVGGSVFHYVITREGALILDGLNIHPSFHVGVTAEAFRALSPTNDVLVDLSRRPDPALISQPSVLIGGVRNHYHWLMEYLPKLGRWRESRLCEEQDPCFLVNRDLSDLQLESLQAFGIGPQALIGLDAASSRRIETLWVPSISAASYAVPFLRQTFLGSETPEAGRILYVSRLDAGYTRGRIANEYEVIRAMDRIGARIIVPGEMSFRDQVAEFARADVVVGAHGAGLTNLAFCAPGCRAIEINNQTNQNYRFFEEIATVASLDFERFVAPNEVPGDSAENAGSIVDCHALAECVGSPRS